MYKVLRLRKTANTDPEQEYELKLQDETNLKPGYSHTTEYGTEAEVRSMLRNGGLAESEINRWFAQAT